MKNKGIIQNLTSPILKPLKELDKGTIKKVIEKELNTFIKPSKIHGLGLFAKRDIPKGERILQGFSNFDDYLDEWIEYVKKWKVTSFAHNNGYCMVNHSVAPNTIRGEESHIIASVDIKKGEEITEDYYALPDHENPFLNTIEESIYRFRKSKRKPI